MTIILTFPVVKTSYYEVCSKARAVWWLRMHISKPLLFCYKHLHAINLFSKLHGNALAQMLFADLSPWRSVFNSKPLHVVFVLAFLRVFQFCPVSFILPVFHTHSFICHQHYVMLAVGSFVTWHTHTTSKTLATHSWWHKHYNFNRSNAGVWFQKNGSWCISHYSWYSIMAYVPDLCEKSDRFSLSYCAVDPTSILGPIDGL
jgi:hypothetical protein